MSDHVYKVLELTGSSAKSMDDAVRTGTDLWVVAGPVRARRR